MNVKELIELANQLSTDSAYITLKERQLYLQYLNMANLELYQVAAGGLKTIIKKADIFLDDATNSFKLPADLYKIRLIFASKSRLLPCDIDEEPEISAGKYLVIGNEIYCNLTSSGTRFLSKIDLVDNNNKRYLTLLYVPNPKLLVENITNAETETNVPVYPLPYHPFLVHGALYYFYFANKIFMEKMAYIRNVWEQDKTKLDDYNNYGL